MDQGEAKLFMERYESGDPLKDWYNEAYLQGVLYGVLHTFMFQLDREEV